MGHIFVYSLPSCKHCRRAKALLEELSLPFVEIDVHALPHRRAEAKRLSGSATVPQIFLNNELIGGNDAL
ncbi:MAG: hypothetical protein MHM6MM_007295, partial [Cercozoa sp. M6MM]